MKKLFAILFTVILSTSVFAQQETTSKLATSTYSAISDDSTYFFNLTDWNKLKFDDLYLLSTYIQSSYIELGGAFKLNENTLMVRYDGNVWAKDDWNRVSLFWGKGNLSLYAAYQHENPGYLNSRNGREYIPSVGFGYNFDNQNAIAIAVSYDSLVGADTAYDVTVIKPVVTYRRYLEDSKTKTTYLKFVYSGQFTTEKYNVTDDSESFSKNTVTSTFGMETKLSDKLKYGLMASLPLEYNKTPTSKIFYIDSLDVRNGISYSLSEMFDFNFGYDFAIPYICIPDEGDISSGSFNNSYCIGFTFKPAETVKIDAYASFYPTNGESVDELSSTKFYFSVQAKF